MPIIDRLNSARKAKINRDRLFSKNAYKPLARDIFRWDERENVKRGRLHQQRSATLFCHAGRLGYANPNRSLLSSKRYVTHIQ